MSLINRRDALIGASAVGGLLLTGCRDKAFIPPSVQDLFGISDALTLAGQRLLLSQQSMAREFSPSMISKSFPAINTIDPDDPTYVVQKGVGFSDWRLPITGMVARPANFSLTDLRAMPSRSQITQHSCERGWSAIAQWTGVQLAHVLAAVGMAPTARWIVFRTVDDWWDSLDLFDALHPQTILAYGMNSEDLPVPHGAPLRLRVERQLGWKNLKYLKSISVTDDIRKVENGRGAGAADIGFPWYAGI